MDYNGSKRFLDTLPDWESGPPPTGPLAHYGPRMRALLDRLDNPQRRFTSIIVGGTNGKGSVGSLLAALLQRAGNRVGFYSSPHLHTIRERLQVDGQLCSRDQWSAQVGRLYDRSRQFAGEGLGDFSKFEALTGLAAQWFAEQEVQYGVFEVGLGGRYDATNAWDSEVAVLTRIDLDHTEILGSDILGIADDKLTIAREGRPLFTTGEQRPEVLAHIRGHCQQRAIALRVSGPDGVEAAEGLQPYPWEVQQVEGPESWRANVRLATAVAHFVAGASLNAEQMADTVARHRWPGRYERARQDPEVILDGAHNPAAAAALAQTLANTARRWDFVVGIGRGHDAAGILAALAPVAGTVWLTAAEHSKAVAPADLAALVPQDVRVEVEPVWQRALQRAVAGAGANGRVCVAGSLYLVALARTFFHLPYEREGVSEDVALESLECIELACQRLGIACRRVAESGNLLRLEGLGRPLYFLRNKHPFNDYVGGRLAEDKGYQYELFTAAGLPVPLSMQVFNPLADDRFNRYKKHLSIDAVIEDVEACLDYPVVVKKYRSSVAQGVFLEGEATALRQRLEILFRHSSFSDNIVLIQTYVPGPEYRVVASQDQLLLAYRKEGVASGQDLNPLHQEGGRAVKVEEDDLLERLAQITRQVAQVVDLGLYAIDLIDSGEAFYILEINPNPFCYFYNRDNGRADFIGLYEYVLGKYLKPAPEDRLDMVEDGS
ncbi:MAG: hypothetical protein GKR89_32655 [Candidatus Latescibacteria bacterium]|nr:hypothetical protein [Candidatus Latescibacterota bacterium]